VFAGMPPKGGGGGAGGKKRNNSLDNRQRTSTTSTSQTRTQPHAHTHTDPHTHTHTHTHTHPHTQPHALPHTQRTGQAGQFSLAGKTNQSKFAIAPLILEGVKLNKLELNDILKQQLNDVKIADIQLARSGAFTIYSTDVQSFNRLLNELASIISGMGQPDAKVYVPRSIQRIKDTEKLAFVKRVDLEIPEDRITEALKTVGLEVTNVTRLTGKDGKTPTRTVKIAFSDVHNRNTFVHTGLQVDCMHFTAEPASQNSKPVQCFICLKYNHVAKYCKTKQQVCARCGDNHRMDQCTVASDAVKCYNCKGNHIATSNDCSLYREQEKRITNMINQYSTTSKLKTTAPDIHNITDFPPLPTMSQRRQDFLQNDFFDQLINVISSKMEKIIKDTTNRLFQKLQQKIMKIEKSIGLVDNSQDDALTISDSDSNEESNVVKHIKSKQSQRSNAVAATASSIDTCNKVTTASNAVTSKLSKKQQKEAKKSTKRVRSSNSSLDNSTNDTTKDLKTSNIDDSGVPH
jgi:hypothetical protein